MSYLGIEEWEYGNAMESSWTILRCLRESLLSISLTESERLPKINEWADVQVQFPDDYGDILENSELFTAIMDILAQHIIDKIGPFNKRLDINMHGLQLIRYTTASTYMLRVKVSYSYKNTDVVLTPIG